MSVKIFLLKNSFENKSILTSVVQMRNKLISPHNDAVKVNI